MDALPGQKHRYKTYVEHSELFLNYIRLNSNNLNSAQKIRLNVLLAEILVYLYPQENGR